jgi:hypothetical protein
MFFGRDIGGSLVQSEEFASVVAFAYLKGLGGVFCLVPEPAFVYHRSAFGDDPLLPRQLRVYRLADKIDGIEIAEFYKKGRAGRVGRYGGVGVAAYQAFGGRAFPGRTGEDLQVLEPPPEIREKYLGFFPYLKVGFRPDPYIRHTRGGIINMSAALPPPYQMPYILLKADFGYPDGFFPAVKHDVHGGVFTEQERKTGDMEAFGQNGGVEIPLVESRPGLSPKAAYEKICVSGGRRVGAGNTSRFPADGAGFQEAAGTESLGFRKKQDTNFKKHVRFKHFPPFSPPKSKIIMANLPS